MRKVPVLTLVSLAVVAAFLVAPAQAQLEVTNGPAIEDNNRMVGEEAGNLFLLGLPADGTATSAVNLGLPEGGSGTPDGGTVAGAALFVSIADMDRNVVASGANTATVDGALEATLNEDGSYAITNLGGLPSAHFVTFGATANGDAAGATVLAAPATDVALEADAFNAAPATGFDLANAEFADGAASFALSETQGTLYFAKAAVEVDGEYVTVSMDYESDSTDVTIAVVAFNGPAVTGQETQYMQLVGAGSIETGAVKNVAVTFKAVAGAVVPAFQVTGPGNVTISNLQVIEAGPLSMYAPEPVDVAFGDWNFNVNGQDAGAAEVADGVMTLTGSAGGDTLANAFQQLSVEGGSVTMECMATAAEGGIFAMVATNGASTINSFLPTAALADGTMISVSGSLPAGAVFAVWQSAGVDATATDLAVMEVADDASAFDANLVP